MNEDPSAVGPAAPNPPNPLRATAEPNLSSGDSADPVSMNAPATPQPTTAPTTAEKMASPSGRLALAQSLGSSVAASPSTPRRTVLPWWAHGGFWLPATSIFVTLCMLVAVGVSLIWLGNERNRTTGILAIGLASFTALVFGVTLRQFARRRHAMSLVRGVHAMMKEGNEREALPMLYRLLAENRLPEGRVIMQFLVAQAHRGLGHVADAITAYQACGPFWPALNNLGTLLLEQRRPADAEKAFAVALKVNPREPLLWNHLALAQQMRHEPILARQTLEALLRLNPRSKATRRNLERLDRGERIDVDAIIPRMWIGFNGL